MALYKGTHRAKLYRGDYRPAQLFYGEKNIAGWEEHTATAQEIKVDRTYKDFLPLQAECVSVQNRPVGKNLYDASKMIDYYDLCILDGNIVFPADFAIASLLVGKLSVLCPNIEVGKTYTLSAKTTSSSGKRVYLTKATRLVEFGSSFTATEADLESEIRWYRCDNGTYPEMQQTVIISQIQVEQGSVATDYQPYDPGVSPENPSPILSTDTDIISENQKGDGSVCHIAGNGIGEIRDSVAVVGGKVIQTKKIGVIESYQGESIETAYLSTTGELSAGARVIYVLPTPVETDITATPAGQAFLDMKTFPPATHIYSAADVAKPILTAKIKSVC